jgi:tetratricopeptide (TPR) repeat protein
MKRQRPRTRVGSSLPARHQLDHVVPTVIHDPEEKMTALGRWTHRAIRNPQKYLGLLAVICGVVLVVLVGWNLVGGGSSRSSEVWAQLETAKKADDRITVAKEHPDSPASTWALLQAATELYNQALGDMPNNRDVALPMFRRALDLFDQIARETPKDSPQARAAALGKARTLEARNELAKAIEQYDLVASTWPGSPEAARAKQLASELKKPEAEQFYKDLYAFAPTRVTLPGFGSQNLDVPITTGVVPDGKSAPSMKTGLLPELPLELAPPLRELRTGPTPSSAKPGAELPADVFSSQPRSTGTVPPVSRNK